VAVSALYLSCSRDTPFIASTQTDISSKATVQVFGATVKAARNYVYVDNVPVSGAAFALGAVFPATAYAFKVEPGSHQFLIKDTMPVTTQVPLTFTQSMDAGKSYTIFTYDTTTNIKQTTVVNNIVVPKDTTCMLRFANFIYNTTALPNVDVYSSQRGNTKVFTSVATNTVTDFIPYAAGRLDTLSVFATGTVTPLLVKIFIPSLVQTRSYTSVYTGSDKGTKVTSTFANY
jgi:hypothetical protein